ncbi:MAG TPA: sugar ABC transporter permease [Oceanobacillus sp.]|nr:sugar ABC transporter permease [Oceanobacillus sp.]
MIAERQKGPNGADVILVGLVALLFLALAVGAFAVVGMNVNASITQAELDEPFGTTLLRFLNTYGIIVPFILVAIGLFLLIISLRLFRREIRAAGWARQLLLWMIIALIVLIVQGFGSGLNAPDGDFSVAMTNVVPFVVGLVLAGAAYWWLGQNMSVFEGVETLPEASSRSAWNLLLPTLIVLVVVAARPLERTFIASLTDAEFARRTEPSFVGLENYAQLLGFRIDSIPCTRDDSGACTVGDNGQIVFARPRDVLDESYRDLRYRELGSGIQIGENRIIFSARDRDFFEAVGNTLYFTVASVALELLLGLFIAMVINSKFSGRGLMRAAMLVPWAIPTVISARLWEIMLRDNQSGVINNFLTTIGVIGSSQAWLANPSLQIPAMIMIDVWKTTPFMALILLAGLQVIPTDIYEAADVDGASKARQFFTLTLPLLRPAIAVALVFRTLDAIRVFDVFQVLLGRAKLSMATYNYEMLVSNQELGYASAIGVIIFIIIFVFAMSYVKLLGVNAE